MPRAESNDAVDPAAAKTAGRRLVAWYRRCARDLPWRRRRDPYAVWVSEVMLQQTTVKTVIPRFEAFIAAFPDVNALAEAGEEKILSHVQGMGYYRRFRAMCRAAIMIRDRHGGRMPRDPDEIARLPGVGPYMTGAIASIAFDLAVPAVDGNVIRVLSRWLAVEKSGASVAERRFYESVVRSMMKSVSPSCLTQALFDLGATVCVPGGPRCAACPLDGTCRSRRDGSQERYPPARRTRGPIDVDAVHLLVRRGSRILFVARSEDAGRLGGFLELPGLWIEPKTDPAEACREWTARHLGIPLNAGARLAHARHAITHHRLNCILFAGDGLPSGWRPRKPALWVELDEIERSARPVTTVSRKLIRRWLATKPSRAGRAAPDRGDSPRP